jgi:tRNA pseudouridine38-40 synthase
MKNIKLTIEYDGTNYSGWQNQDNAVTVQEKLEEAIKELTKEEVKLIGSGRTDSGVHARGQVANFFTNSTIPGEKFKYALNNILPGDIAIIESEEVDVNFHSRFDAVKKRYRYRIYNGEMPRPLYRNYSYHYKYNLDLDKMREAAKYLIGTHDFVSFMGSGSVVKTTIRTIYKIDIQKLNEFIDITLEGDSFLRYMVRIIVGTLLKVGNNQISADEIPRIIEAKDRHCAGPTVPPQGLYLEEVYYPQKTS